MLGVTFQGITNILDVMVRRGGDSDSDGLPDDYELSNGLNPNDPSDASADLDRDGLTNLEEFQRGTDPRNPDTDGDGLKDGEEVLRGTNPLLADTDGDGIPDGLEIQLGSNPLDPNSGSLATALDHIEVTPPTASLIVNTLSPQASIQLRVTGVLKDNSKLDLSSFSRGTRYSSSDLTICNFGARDGEIFAGQPGMCMVTVANGSFRTTVPIRVDNFNPTVKSQLSIPGSNALDVVGRYAYVVGGSQFRTVDILDRANPVVLKTLDVQGADFLDVKVSGNYAYAPAGAVGFAVIDIASPANPQLVRVVSTPGIAQDVSITNGTRLYLADGISGLLIYDLDDPANPVLRSTTDVGTAVVGVDADATRQVAALALDSAGLRLIDISNAASPKQLGLLPGGVVKDVLLRGSVAFLADYTRSFTAVDIADPNNPRVTTSIAPQFGGFLFDIALAGDYAFGADIFFVNDTPVIDVSTPQTPVARFRFAFPGDATGTGVKADASFVYLLSGGYLSIGQYRSVVDNNGIAPQVSIFTPTPGSSLVGRTAVPVTIQATDDIAVATVQLLVNGQVVGTAVSAPYIINLPVPKGITSLTIQARAIDFGGNVGISSDVGYNLVVGALTTVTGTGVDRQGAAVPNARMSVVSEFYGQSAADGSYSITGVPAALGRFRAYGEVAGPGGVVLRGRSGWATAVPNGITNVGSMIYFPDADWDGLPDDYEALNGCLNVNSADDDLDPDGDGISNFDEYLAKTDPCVGNLLPGQRTAMSALISLRNGPPPSAVLPAGFNEASSALISVRNGPPTGAVLPSGFNEISSALISVLNGPPPGSVLPDGFNEVSSALVSLRNGPAPSAFLPDGLNEVSSALVSLRNGSAPGAVLPDGFNEVSSALVSLRNGPAPALGIGQSEVFTLVTVLNDPSASFSSVSKAVPLVDPAAALSVGRHTRSIALERYVTGQAVWARYGGAKALSDMASVEFLLDGASLGEVREPPYETMFVIPEGVLSLQVRAVPRSKEGKALAAFDRVLAIDSPGVQDYSIRVIDGERPVPQNATVTVTKPGLLAEVFDSNRALTEMPQLEGRRPDTVTDVSAVAFRNPDGIFGPDPFGTRFSPDFSIRFSGQVTIAQDGIYRFAIRSHEGARLTIDKEEVLIVPGGSIASTLRENKVRLAAGPHTVQIEYYATVRAPEIEWTYAAEGQSLRPVPSEVLSHSESMVTGVDGVVSLKGIAGWMEGTTIWRGPESAKVILTGSRAVEAVLKTQEVRQ